MDGCLLFQAWLTDFRVEHCKYGVATSMNQLITNQDWPSISALRIKCSRQYVYKLGSNDGNYKHFPVDVYLADLCSRLQLGLIGLGPARVMTAHLKTHIKMSCVPSCVVTCQNW